MNFKEEHIDLFDRYLRNQLEPAEIADFEKRLQEDEAFSKSFLQYQLLTEGVRDYGRNQLKNFLKENAHSLHVTKPIQPRRIFLIAASIVLILGIFAIIKLSVKPLEEKNLAINNQSENAPAVENTPAADSAMSTSEPPKNEKFREMVAVDKNLAVDNPPPQLDVMAKDIGMAEIEDLSQNSGPEDVYYKVLSDVKLKDTSLAPVYLTLSLTDMFSNEADAKINNDSETKKLSSLPYNVYSGTNAAPKASSTSKQPARAKEVAGAPKSDSVEVKNKVSTKKQVDQNTSKINIQYWKSPINFTGYTYINNTIQIYGFEPGTCTLYSVNNKLYLKHQNQVYAIEICEKSCPMKIATDSDIVKLILSH